MVKNYREQWVLRARELREEDPSLADDEVSAMARELATIDAQREWVKAEFGDEAAANADYGKVMGMCDSGFGVSTRVRGHGYLTSEMLDNGDVRHEWE